jgi:hypothetical protein
MQVCSNKGPSFLQRGDKHKNVKIGLGFLLQNQQAKFNQTWDILSLGKGNASFLKKKGGARSSSKER